MRATFIYRVGDVRVINVPEPAGAGNARVVAVLRNPHCRAKRLKYVAILPSAERN